MGRVLGCIHYSDRPPYHNVDERGRIFRFCVENAPFEYVHESRNKKFHYYEESRLPPPNSHIEGRPPRWAKVIEFGTLATKHYAKTCWKKVVILAGYIADFIKANWTTLLTYAFAWGVILGCIGLMHGFRSTSAPFSVGMGAGVGLGALIALICVKVFKSSNSMGGRLNGRISTHLDFTTKQIFLTVFVAVYLVAASRFPHGVGALTGIIVGDHIMTTFLHGGKLIKAVRGWEERIQGAEDVGNETQRQITELQKERQEEIALLRREHAARLAHLETAIRRLERGHVPENHLPRSHSTSDLLSS